MSDIYYYVNLDDIPDEAPPICVGCRMRVGKMRSCGQYICDYCYCDEYPYNIDK